MAIIKLQTSPIDVGRYYSLLKDEKYGGIDLFVGTVREWTKKSGKAEHTEYIEYTAYEEMAMKELQKLAAPIEARGDRVVIVHRLGRLELTDEAVLIGVASPHREAAFEGCHSIIDRLKETVPIWKKEVDGEIERWGK